MNEDEIHIAASENTFVHLKDDSFSIRREGSVISANKDGLTMESSEKIVIQSNAGIDLVASGSKIKMAANIDLTGSNVNIS